EDAGGSLGPAAQVDQGVVRHRVSLRRPLVSLALSDVVSDPELPPAAPSSLLRTSSLVALGTALSRGTGFLRLFATGYAISYAALTDTYTLANNTPNIVYELVVGGVLSATLVPVFVHHTEEDDDAGTSAVITVATAALIALVVTGIFAAPALMRLYTMTADGQVADQQRHVATALLRLFMPQMLFYGLTAMGTAVLNARRKFLAAAFAPVLNNLIVVGVLLALPHVAGHTPTLNDVGHDNGLLVLLGLGTTAGIVAMTLVLLPAVIRSGFRFRFNFAPRNPAVKEVARMSGWTLGYVIANQIALFIVLLLANRRVSGVATYTTAYIVFLLPHALVTVSLVTTLAPQLASSARRQATQAYRDTFALGVRLMALIVLPAATGYIVLGQPIIHALLFHGAVKPAEAHLIGSNLAMFGTGLFGFSLYLYTLNGFYARRDTRTPFFLNVGENVLNIGLALILQPHFGVPGLALSFALAYNISAVVALATLRRRVGRLDSTRSLQAVARIAVACAVMAATVAVVSRVVGDSALVQTAAGVLVGGAVYLGMLLLLRVEDVATLRSRLLRRA
ncbi:MAG: murein biosynthesis integral rane protein MurJ, partial [Actinomycetia bacterium]|nr:murein biosynthesis integral rane protein MurJ [Actinomycetes bacterium]